MLSLFINMKIRIKKQTITKIILIVALLALILSGMLPFLLTL
jgi:hypothetical protein